MCFQLFIHPFNFFQYCFIVFNYSFVSLAKLTLKHSSMFYVILTEVVFISSSSGWSL